MLDAQQLETAGSICKTALQAVASPRRGTSQVKPATSVTGYVAFKPHPLPVFPALSIITTLL